ncbi:unnamed protein product [Echinostoma caproni]|uniref:Uncharacterized protein n=1 Tax=Echinostoma caproni TaxID=27848 RepID=A0A183B3S9_9TREM|nr:unnamed protein product [Echinostoma caproni]
MTNSSMTDEAALSDPATTYRTLYRKRQSPSSSGTGAMNEAPRNGMRKYCRHETLTLRALMAGKVSSKRLFSFGSIHSSSARFTNVFILVRFCTRC